MDRPEAGDRSPPPVFFHAWPAVSSPCGAARVRANAVARFPHVDLRAGKPQVVRSNPNAKQRLPPGRPQPEEGRMAYPFKLPELPYPYDALEPHIDARTMEIHHSKHHAAYTNNLNAALEKYPDLHGREAEDLLRDINSVPEDIRTAVRNNGGGFVNHNMFWQIMAPGGKSSMSSALTQDIEQAFGSVDAFKDAFSKA